ncbi:MAG: D-2-hydroxyacid dehydrogenase [Candidatus Symbiothrix sp.]|nr:D-2-hydroxyacid dehydrogenase [Candidatus Symbiothrix sp.]
MKAVVLDGYTLNPGDLNWKSFNELCECEIYDYTAPDEIIERSADADFLITNKTVLPASVIECLPKLKYIGVLATGYNVVDIEAARKKGIVVANVPAYATDSVAQLVFAHILNIANQVEYHSEEVKKGRWAANRDFSFWDKHLMSLKGLTIGIVALGNIGNKVAQIAQAFDMQVIAFTSKTPTGLPPYIQKADLETLFRSSDIISLHCPLTPDTEKLINAETLSLMKPSAILINTGRGGLIDEEALARALNENKLFAAGLDVLSTEPPKKDNPLLTAKNCYITPHIGWATYEARQDLMNIAAANLRAFIEGRPQNVVS